MQTDWSDSVSTTSTTTSVELDAQLVALSPPNSAHRHKEKEIDSAPLIAELLRYNGAILPKIYERLAALFEHEEHDDCRILPEPLPVPEPGDVTYEFCMRMPAVYSSHILPAQLAALDILHENKKLFDREIAQMKRDLQFESDKIRKEIVRKKINLLDIANYGGDKCAVAAEIYNKQSYDKRDGLRKCAMARCMSNNALPQYYEQLSEEIFIKSEIAALEKKLDGITLDCVQRICKKKDEKQRRMVMDTAFRKIVEQQKLIIEYELHQITRGVIMDDK